MARVRDRNVLFGLLAIGALLVGCAPAPGRAPDARRVDAPSVDVPGSSSLQTSGDPLADGLDETALLLARANDHIRTREYWATPSARGLQAPNRAHAIRTYFEREGIVVADRQMARPDGGLSLRLHAIGRGPERTEVGPGEVEIDGARVTIVRDGLVEWYVNDSRGLEQGFEIAQPPRGRGPLVLELALRGATAKAQGHSIRLLSAGGRRFDYGHLAAFDADGRELASRMRAESTDRIALVIDDSSATYPVLVDPLLESVADAQLDTDQAQAGLGTSVASAGDVDGDGYADVLVGAPRFDAGELDEGAAFLFMGGPNGIGDADVMAAATFLQSNQPGALLGKSVAGAGDVDGDGYADVIVGAPDYASGQAAEGAAFLCLGDALGIPDGDPGTAAAFLESDQADARFGAAVSTAGDVDGDGRADVIVGAPLWDGGELDEGGAFVFHGSVSGLVGSTPATAATRLEGDQAGAGFGTAVARAGDIDGDGFQDVIVGAPFYDHRLADEGVAAIFLGGPGGLADSSPLFSATFLEGDQIGAEFGWSVAGAGDLNGDGFSDVVVGAPRYDAFGLDEGAAFVFLGTLTGIDDGNPLTADGAIDGLQPDAQLGTSVAGAGDLNGDGFADLAVGAIAHSNGQTGEGAVFVFAGRAEGLLDVDPSTALAQVEADQAFAGLGISVAGAGDVDGDGFGDLIAGAADLDGAAVDGGGALVFVGGAHVPAVRTMSDFDVSVVTGAGISGAGDVNGDGFDDVVLGLTSYNGPLGGEGAIVVHHGGPGGLSETPSTTLLGVERNAYITRARGIGDVNGDGYGDILVWDNYLSRPDLFVFHGGPAGLPPSAALPATVLVAGAEFFPTDFTSLLGALPAGDVNGDGYGDLLVRGANPNTSPFTYGAFVFHGGPNGIASGTLDDADAILLGDQLRSNWASDMAAAGDVNGDGYGDVVVGAQLYAAPEFQEGAIFIYHGSADGIPSGGPEAAATRIEGGQVGAGLGLSVAGLGDVNGDGYADVAAGAGGYDGRLFDQGAVFVFHGRAGGIPSGNAAVAVADTTLQSSNASAGFAFVTALGDITGDGHADLMVEAVSVSVQARYVFLGAEGGIPDAEAASAAGRILAPNSGAANLGDVNGDGFTDLALVSSGNRVFYANSPGRAAAPQALRGDGSDIPIQAWSYSEDATSFRVAMYVQHPEGRGAAKLEVEACPYGTAFGSPACTTRISDAWTDTGTTPTGVRLVESVSVVPGSPLYRWRVRALHASLGVLEPGIAVAPSPARGPWRQASEATGMHVVRLPEPTGLTGPACGLVALVAIARRRDRRRRTE